LVIGMVRISFHAVLSPVELSRLEPTRFADVRWSEETDSTNAQLLALAREGAPEGVVLVADHQSAGRGRLGRTWQAPPGSSLLASVLLRPSLPPDRVHLVTVAAGLAAAEACTEVAGFTPSLKWPNDLVVEGSGDEPTRKLAGLLAEAVVVEGRIDAVVLGMGLNVVWPAELPEELAATAVALNHVVDRPVRREDLLVAWLLRLEERDASLRAGGADGVLADYRARCSTLGRRVRVELASEVLEGEATDVTADGHLLVDVGGTTRELAVGDVVHLRPAG
jgi:BirA family transcriptional regulator, biotin operon repressor / biotin---[acetyl-CoA-carboxylase] ligase